MAHLCLMALPLVLITCPSHVDAPGEPVKVQVEAEVGGDAILPCNLHTQLDNETLRVKWEHKGLVVHFYRSGKDDYSTQDDNFKNRTFLNRELDNGKTSLKLTNVTERDYGNYICTIMYKRLHRKYNVTLEPVKKGDTKNQPDPKDSENTGSSEILNNVFTASMVVIVAAIIIAIVSSVIRIKCRNRRYRQGQREQIEMDDLRGGGRDLGAGPDGRGQHVQVEMEDAEDEG